MTELYRPEWDDDQPRQAPRLRMSHSRFETYVSCGEKFRLRYVDKVPEEVGLSLPAGTAFHMAADWYDNTGTKPPWADIFEAAVLEREEETGTKRDEWRYAGKKTAKTPNKEDVDYWRDVLGPELVDNYMRWRDNTDTTIAHDLPEGLEGNTDGIEYGMVYRLGDVDIKAYVDRVEYDVNGNLGVVDLKTWSRRRKGPQLPGYIWGLQTNGINVTWGAYYEARKGALTDPTFYTSWTADKVAALYAQAAVMQQQGFYLPNPSEDCSWCSVRAHCRYAL